MDEQDILARIQGLVEREHLLRTELQEGTIRPDDEHGQLQQVEQALDQAWDLLRQRRARSEYGQDPEDSTTRGVDQVEKYLQ